MICLLGSPVAYLGACPIRAHEVRSVITLATCVHVANFLVHPGIQLGASVHLNGTTFSEVSLIQSESRKKLKSSSLKKTDKAPVRIQISSFFLCGAPLVALDLEMYV